MTVILSFTKVHRLVLGIKRSGYTDKSTHDSDSTVHLPSLLTTEINQYLASLISSGG
jgi:hypothetical protein